MMSSASSAPHPPSSPVKELADHVHCSSASLPSVFITRSKADAEAETVVEEKIPKIDLFLLRKGNPDERLRIVRDIERACKEWGCFTLVNHGLSESLQTAILKAFMEFFNLTTEEKEVYSIKQLFDNINYGTGFSLTGKNVRYWRDFLRMFVHPEFNSPAKPACFREISEEYTRQAGEICKELLRAIWESLELEESFMEDSLKLKSYSQILVGNIFPPCPQPELVFGMPPHTDPCLFSFVIQNNSFNGLQVMHDEKWVVVELLSQSLLVLIGDFMEIVSNGKYKSILHRVMVRNENTRILVGTSIGPPVENVVIAPEPKLLEKFNSPAIFRGVTTKEFIELKKNNKSKGSVMDILKL